MPSPRSQTPPLKAFVCTLHRQKLAAGLTFLSAIGLALAVVFFYPRSYQSEAKVFVRKGRETVSLDPTATTGQVTALVDSHEREINSVVALMKSRYLAEKVVTELGPEAVLSGGARQGAERQEEGSSPQTLLKLLPTIDEVSATDRAIRRVQQRLRVNAERDSNVITLRYVDRSPGQAQKVTAALLRAYRSEHLRVNRTEGSKKFFDQQTVLLHKRWREAIEKLRALKDAGGFASIETHRNLLEGRISRTSEELADAETKLAASRARCSLLERLIASLPKNKVSEWEEGHPNVSRDGMRQQLYDLELLERGLSAKFGDSHPKLAMVRSQLEDAQRILETQKMERVHTKTSVNAERESLHLSLLNEKANAEALEAGVKRLVVEHAQLIDSMRALNQRELEVADMQQKVNLTAAAYRSYAENLEQTRIDEALEANRISNVNTYQSASLETRPVSPRKGLVCAAGLVLATIASILVVVVREHLDTTLRTEEEVESELDLLVLAAVPNQRRAHRLLATRTTEGPRNGQPSI